MFWRRKPKLKPKFDWTVTIIEETATSIRWDITLEPIPPASVADLNDIHESLETLAIYIQYVCHTAEEVKREIENILVYLSDTDGAYLEMCQMARGY